VIVKDMAETQELGRIILGELPWSTSTSSSARAAHPGFDPARDLQRIGVVNQTTMLATETQAIADHLKQVMVRKNTARPDLKEHFADTRDTLCYATNDNQDATNELLKAEADLALVVGGYNSSNTSHLVELLEHKFPTYFIKDEKEILSAERSSTSTTRRTSWRARAIGFLRSARSPSSSPAAPVARTPCWTG
jgi:4-hydroxy-3-methylbut-2-enyl diphosphate reductase